MKANTPVRLHKVEPTSKFDDFCMIICPYVIIVAVVVIVAMALWVAVKYGGMMFGTEANIYYNNFMKAGL